MGEPLLSEGPDLAALIAQIQSEHGANATIIYHDCVRRGGVGGFFAREIHRVAYRVADAPSAPASPPTAPPASRAADGSALDALLAEADARDLELQVPAPPAAVSMMSVPDDTDTFAAMLRIALDEPEPFDAPLSPEVPAMAGTEPIQAPVDHPVVQRAVFPTIDSASLLPRPAAPAGSGFGPLPIIEARETALPAARARHRAAEDDERPDGDRHAAVAVASALTIADVATEAVADSIDETAADPAGVGAPTDVPALASVTSMHPPAARARLDVLMQLRELGVPVAMNPRTNAHSVYAAVQEILAGLPSAQAPSSEPGTVTAILGELAPALRAAQGLAAALRLPRSAIWIAGLTGHPVESLVDSPDLVSRTVSGPGHARLLRSDLRAAETCSLVVIATDAIEGDPDDTWAAQVLAALEPDTALLTVDASRKPEDERDRLARLDITSSIDALAVHSARLTSSPASVWDLGLPVALLDGRPATAFAWSSLLLAAVPSEARHRTTA